MRVEVLFVSECPSYPAAVQLVRDALATEGVTTGIHEVLVRDERMAGELKFVGSPTIRINGRDIAGESQAEKNFALCCRLYPGSKRVGLPPAELVHRAVVEARREDQP